MARAVIKVYDLILKVAMEMSSKNSDKIKYKVVTVTIKMLNKVTF